MSTIFKTSLSEMKEKAGIKFTEPTRTKQDFKNDCDVNEIMRRFNATGIVSHVSEMQPVYGDVRNFDDYAKNLAYVRQADDAFAALPSNVRAELDNNPANLVSFIQNPANRDRCIELGIFNKPVKEVEHVVVQAAGTSPSPAAEN